MKIGNRWLRLLVGCVTLFMAGIIYAWSKLNVPLVAEFKWSEAETRLCFTITLCFFCLGGLFSGLLSKMYSPRTRMIAAAIMVGAGFTFTGCTNGNVIAVYLAYGVLGGTGIGIVYNVVISLTNAWFPDKKGLSSGALMMSFGFSTLVFAELAHWLFDMPDFGWRRTFTLFGIAIGAVVLLAAFIVKQPETSAKQAPTASGDASDMTATQMVRRLSYWKLFAFFTLLSSVGATVISFANNFFISIGMEKGTAATFVGLVSVFNGLGRLFAGAYYDRYKLRKTQYATSFIAILAPATAFLALILKSPALGAGALCLCGVSYGFSPTVSAAFATGFYGTKNFSLNFAVINLVLIPASFASTLMSGLDYIPTFIVLTAMSVVGLFVNLSIKKA